MIYPPKALQKTVATAGGSTPLPGKMLVAADVDCGGEAKIEGMAKSGLAEAPNHGVIAHVGMLSVITTARLQARGLLREYMEVSIHAPLSGL